MKRGFILIILAALALTSCRTEQTPEDRALGLAEDFIESLVTEDYDKCLEQTGPETDMSREKLSGIWMETWRKAGSLQSVEDTSAQALGDKYTCRILALHTNMDVIYTMEYRIDQSGSVLTGVEITAQRPETPREYGIPDGIIEEKVIVSQDSGYPLDGKLSLPSGIKDGEKIPAVVLVHDAGVWDMDASVFDNKPFRDIAHYLAGKGIAVLRYDKLTYAYPDGLDRPYDQVLTPEIGTVYDAIYARMLLAGNERIDQERVYVLGHGLGGSMAAEICVTGGFTGYISMAGSPRNPVELAYDRNLYNAVLTGGSEDAAMAAMESDIESYYALSDTQSDASAEIDVLGISGYYLKSLADSPASEYLNAEVPALVLQGTNDFEVFYDRDYEMLKTFLAGSPLAEFQLFEGLNHMFMWSTMEKPSERDYIPDSRVEEDALEKIASWVMNEAVVKE